MSIPVRDAEEPLTSGLVVLPHENQVVAEIDYRYFFSIDSEKFAHIVTELHFFYDTSKKFNSSFFFMSDLVRRNWFEFGLSLLWQFMLL